MPKQTFLNLPAKKRRRIEAAAADAFFEYGYQAASISQIVAQAGIPKGSFYQYFADKQDLFMHLVHVVGQEKQAFFQGLQPPTPDMDFFRYLRWLFKAGYAYAAVQSKGNQAVSRVLFGEGLFLGEAFCQLREASTQTFNALVKQAVERGEITQAVDPAVSAFVIETLLNSLGLFILTQQPLNREELQQGALDWLYSARAQKIVDDLLHVLEYGLRNPAKQE